MKPLKSSQVDLAIVGGGINGAGLALLAAKAGLSVALFEKDDFASGTSSKSTKLIHGGIRYLEQYRFSLVFESLHERQKLLKLAPHLIHPISILLPCYKTDRRPPWMLKIGLWLYDILAGSSNIARHRWYSAEETKIIAPTLKTDGLKGCGLYYDAQVNDARLVLENILAAEEAGADCLNYCCVNQIDREEGFVRVFFQESRTKENGVLQAKCLVNAAGPWANQITKLISENALSLIRPTRGSHIVMPEVLSQHAVLIMTPKDNRIIFIVPCGVSVWSAQRTWTIRTTRTRWRLPRKRSNTSSGKLPGSSPVPFGTETRSYRLFPGSVPWPGPAASKPLHFHGKTRSSRKGT